MRTSLLAGVAVAAAAISLIGTAASASSRQARAAASSPPSEITAVRITRTPGTLRRGSRVSSRDVGERTFLDAHHGFALAGVGQADYPVATANGGKTWRTNGPALHLDAAQAPLSVIDSGAANRHTYFACCGGQVVDATGDGGRHWWRAFLGDVVLAVSARGHGRLIAVAQRPANPSGTRTATWVYVSRDGGHHWHYDNQEEAI